MDAVRGSRQPRGDSTSSSPNVVSYLGTPSLPVDSSPKPTTRPAHPLLYSYSHVYDTVTHTSHAFVSDTGGLVELDEHHQHLGKAPPSSMLVIPCIPFHPVRHFLLTFSPIGFPTPHVCARAFTT
jgi:hypothetical protein